MQIGVSEIMCEQPCMFSSAYCDFSGHPTACENGPGGQERSR